MRVRERLVETLGKFRRRGTDFPFWARSLLFAGVFVFLSSVVNIRYPGPAPYFWFLVPSLDIVLVFSAFVVLGLVKREVPAWSLGALTGGLLLVRLLRTADGISMRYLQRELNLYVDAPLFPEFVVLMRQTQSSAKLVAVATLFAAGVAGLALVLFFALRFASRRLTERRFQLVFAGLLGLAVLVWPLRSVGGHEGQFLGPFANSVVPRFVRGAGFLLNAERYVEERHRNFERAQSELGRVGTDLAGLGGADVYLIFVESYGSTLMDRDVFRSKLGPVYRGMESAFASEGIAVASGLLNSPTYGGFSWRAHQTLATGVRVESELDHDLLARNSPKTLGGFFKEAGYRTVLVQPGTTRSYEPGVFSEFDAKYAAQNFGYRGPKFGWAAMPDQYVLDFVERTESARATSPLFVEIALISSHGPWDRQPPLVEDWSALEDGSIFHRLPSVRYDSNWTNLEQAEEAYMSSIRYVLQALQSFVVERVSRDALFIVLGDHQPPAPLTEGSSSHAVPIHAISRRAALVEPFIKEGYTAGMIPNRDAPNPGMERFLSQFLDAFSGPHGGGVR